MKITQIEAIPVCVPLKKGLSTKTAHGEHVVSPYVIVKIHTDAGLVGLGEATLAPRWSGETSQGCRAVLRELIIPALLGENPLAIHHLRSVMNRVVKLNPFTKAAVEMALWDLLGKHAGVPIHELLGGPLHKEFPIKMVIGAFDIPQAKSLAERFLKQGTRALKVKVGIDVAEDVARVAAVRELAPADCSISVDANCGWSFTEARRALQALEAYSVCVAEQPIPPGDPLALAELRRGTTIPIMADESIFTLEDGWQLAVARAADVLSLYPGKHGGIAATIEIANLAKGAGMACTIGSNLELGIGTAAMLQVAAVLGVVDCHTYPADLIGPCYHEADLLKQPLTLGPTVARLPEGPGLGVELDEAQLNKYREE